MGLLAFEVGHRGSLTVTLTVDRKLKLAKSLQHKACGRLLDRRPRIQ